MLQEKKKNSCVCICVYLVQNKTHKKQTGRMKGAVPYVHLPM